MLLRTPYQNTDQGAGLPNQEGCFTMHVGRDQIGKSASGDVGVPASAGDAGPRVSYYWGLGSLRTGADPGPRLGSGARSDGNMKRVLLDVMAVIRRSATSSARYMCGLPDHTSTTVKAAEGSQDESTATGTVDRQCGYTWMDIEAPRPWSLQSES